MTTPTNNSPTDQPCPRGAQWNSPTIHPHPTDYHGHFIVELPASLKFNLAGIETNGAETLVRLGILPHNHSICQKIIQTMGRRALKLLQQQDPDRPRRANNFWCQTTCDEAELYSLWQFIDIVSAVKPLERAIAANDTQDMHKMVEAVLTQLKAKQKQSCYQGLAETRQDTVLFGYLEKTHNELIQLAITQAKVLSSKIDQDPIERQECFHHLLHTLLNQFEQQQTAISVAQRGVSNWLVLANSTNTTATQTAYYQLQDHLYSAYGCTAEHQWQQVDATKDTLFDTTTFSSLRQTDALYAACLIHENGTTIEKRSKAKVLRAAAHKTLDIVEKIKDAHIGKKGEIDRVRLENVDGWHDAWQSLCARWGWFRDQSMREAFAGAPLATGSYSWWQVPLSHLTAQPIKTTPFTEDPAKINIQRALRTTFTQWQNSTANLPSTQTTFSGVTPAIVYLPSDLYSAIASFGSEFSQYFNRELASKYPTLTTLAFIVPSLYGTALTLEGANLMPQAAQSLYQLLSKIMSINGLLVDPNSLNTAAAQVNHAWIEITGAESIGKMILFNSVGLPKLTTFAVDILMPQVIGDAHTIIGNLKEQFGDKRIDTNSLSDEIREQIKSLCTKSMLITTALALGAAAPSMATAGPFFAAIGDFISFFDHIDGDALAHGLDSPKHAISTLLQVKTGTLFLAKFYTVKHLATKQDVSTLQAALDFFEEHTLAPTHEHDYQTHREVLERAIAYDPMLKASIGIDLLNSWKIREYRPAPPWLLAFWQFCKKVAGTINTLLIGALALLPSLVYMAFTPSHAVPKNRAAAYAFKQALKLNYGWLRGGPLFTVLGIKFFAIALGGALLRLLVASVDTLGMILVFPVNVAERLYRKGVTNAAGYLGVNLLSMVKIPCFVLESICYLLSMAVLLPVTAGVCMAISHMQNERFKTIWRQYQQHHRPLSEMCEDLRLKFLIQHPDEKIAQLLTAYVFRLSVGVAELGIGIKNWLGHGALWWRDHTLRRLEHRLQFVEKTIQLQTDTSEKSTLLPETPSSPFSRSSDESLTAAVARRLGWPGLFAHISNNTDLTCCVNDSSSLSEHTPRPGC